MSEEYIRIPLREYNRLVNISIEFDRRTKASNSYFIQKSKIRALKDLYKSKMESSDRTDIFMKLEYGTRAKCLEELLEEDNEDD